MRFGMRALLAAGVCALGATGFSAANAVTVVNGGFETGDFTGWTQFGDPTFASVDGEAGVVHSGSYAASFGQVVSGGGISQLIATTAGSTYTLDFWLQAESDPLGAATPNSVLVSWNGATVNSLSLTNTAAFSYQHFFANVTATSSSTLLKFTFRDDPAFLDLDDVALNVVSAPVPEPETWAMIGVGLAWVAAKRRRALSRKGA